MKEILWSHFIKKKYFISESTYSRNNGNPNSKVSMKKEIRFKPKKNRNFNRLIAVMKVIIVKYQKINERNPLIIFYKKYFISESTYFRNNGNPNSKVSMKKEIRFQPKKNRNFNRLIAVMILAVFFSFLLVYYCTFYFYCFLCFFFWVLYYFFF